MLYNTCTAHCPGCASVLECGGTVCCIILTQLTVPAVPVFLSVVGLYDVEYQVSVAARDACIYTIKGGGRTPKYRFSVGSQPCGMQRIDKELVVGCMDQTLGSYSVKVS